MYQNDKFAVARQVHQWLHLIDAAGFMSMPEMLA
jgi:hypothetical protein